MRSNVTGAFGKGQFTDKEEEAINAALQKRLGPNYISKVAHLPTPKFDGCNEMKSNDAISVNLPMKVMNCLPHLIFIVIVFTLEK
jgi:hypothetical protein